MVFAKDVHLTRMKVNLDKGDGVLLSLLSLDMKGGKGLVKQMRERECFTVSCYS